MSDSQEITTNRSPLTDYNDRFFSEDFFSLLSLPRSFDLYDRHLEQHYYALQRRFHPDSFVGRPSEEREKFREMSKHVSTAYHTLRSPIKRAEYLLFLKGVKLNGPDSNIEPCKDVCEEIAMLKEQMKEAATPEDIHRVSASVRDREAECQLQLGEMFAEDNLTEATQLTLRYRMLTQLTDELRKRLFELHSRPELV